MYERNKINLEAMKCPTCGGGLAGNGICPYCGIAHRVAETGGTPKINVKGEGDKPQIGVVEFDRRIKFTDKQLEAIAAQVVAGMAATETEPAKGYSDFSLPLPPKSGRPPALLVEAHRGVGDQIAVLFGNSYVEKTDQRLRSLGRIINLPTES